MNYLKRFGSFWYHFVVGDDWRIAGGVVIGLTLVAFLTHSVQIQVWWLLPVMVVIMLSLSLWHATRRR